MVNTPTIWKGRYQLNHTDIGEQRDPDIVDIGMGRFVAVWTESSGGPIGTANGSDLVGQIFDAKGHRVGNEFQVNWNYKVDNEQDAALATRPGGGFVMVYEDNDASGTSIRVETYDVNGVRLSSGVPFSIAGDPGADALSNPAIATRSDGSYLVAYNHYYSATGHTSIVGKVVDAAGNVSSEKIIFDSADTTRNPDVAALSNGNYVVVFEDADSDAPGSDYDPQFSIRHSTGGFVSQGNFDTGANNQTDVHVAALKNGGFVGVWQEANGDGSSSGIRAAVYNNAGTELKAPFTVNTTTAGSQNEPEITSLKDGGFVVVWDDDGANLTRGQRFDANGNTVGHEFNAGSLGSEEYPVVAALSDGRFIAGFEEYSSDDDIHGTIFDPRGKHIVGTNQADVLTARKNGAEVIGKRGADILLGHKGDDELHGGRGGDKLAGGRGKDMLWGAKGHDKFVFDTALGNGNIDRIQDMQHNVDKIWLDRDIFSAIGNKLDPGEFHQGSHAHDGNDRIIYTKSKGTLFFDPDGQGGVGKTQFAKVDPGTNLDNGDFHMIQDLVI